MNEALRHVNRYKMLHVMIAHLSQDKTIETSHKSLLAKITHLAPKVFYIIWVVNLVILSVLNHMKIVLEKRRAH